MYSVASTRLDYFLLSNNIDTEQHRITCRPIFAHNKFTSLFIFCHYTQQILLHISRRNSKYGSDRVTAKGP